MACDVLTRLFHRGKNRIEEYGLAWVESFGDLHDHMDANGITSIDDDFEWEKDVYGPIGVFDYKIEDDAGDPRLNWADKIDLTHDALHLWLRDLAPAGALAIEG